GCHSPKITVVGCGKSGADIISNMYKKGVWDERIVFLPIEKVDTRDVGLKDVDLVINVFCSDDMNIASMVAREARENGVLVVSVIIKSQGYEREIENLLDNQGESEVLFVIDDIDLLVRAIDAISMMILSPEKVDDICIDFADLRTILCGGGRAFIGKGKSVGSNASHKAFRDAIEPLSVEGLSIDNAMGALVAFKTHPDYNQEEIHQVLSTIHEALSDYADVIFGAISDKSMMVDEAEFSICITGIETPRPKRKKEERMKIKILKGTDEIGGSCIELSTANTTILLDYGTPLSDESEKITLESKVDAILISHPHQDHFGEIVNIDSDTPIYCGALSLELMNATKIFTGKEKLSNNFHHFEAWKSFSIGDFTITPYLVDHSATDAYAFLVEANSQKLLYSGDFRANGRKSKLFENMLTDKKLKDVDVLLMEGTMIERSNSEFPDEQSVEQKIYEVLGSNNELSFMICSSQNIDSIVSAYRACKRTNKIFVIDIYTAWILEKVKTVSKKIMNLDFSDVKVYKPTIETGGNQYGKIKDNQDYFKDFGFKIFHKNNIITFDEIKQNPSSYFIKCSHWYIENILEAIEQDKANVIYSQWLGYMKEEFSDQRTAELFENLKGKYNWVYAHTSGHADLESLQKFSKAINPKRLIPIHTEHKEDFQKHFENVCILEDNESYKVGSLTMRDEGEINELFGVK
ncbi:MAG: MBL fold metallo-hydrolase, partial [Campylobacterales bacterium]